MVRVKVCGITNLDDAQAAVELGADAVGFVFAQSPRRVTEKRAREIVKKIAPFVTAVGVFVNERTATVRRIVAHCALSLVQLHGDETASYTKSLACCKVIKAFRVDERFSLKGLGRFPADLFLFDARIDGLYGGTGRSFDWDLLKRETIPKPFIVSGGLHPANVRRVIKRLSPYAVDVSSGVEKRPGIKDHKLLREFIRNAKTEN